MLHVGQLMYLCVSSLTLIIRNVYLMLCDAQSQHPKPQNIINEMFIIALYRSLHVTHMCRGPLMHVLWSSHARTMDTDVQSVMAAEALIQNI